MTTDIIISNKFLSHLVTSEAKKIIKKKNKDTITVKCNQLHISKTGIDFLASGLPIAPVKYDIDFSTDDITLEFSSDIIRLPVKVKGGADV